MIKKIYKNIYKISGISAFVLGILFLAGIITLFLTNLGNFQNWLILLFKINFGIEGVKISQLYGINILDITLLIFTGIMFLGLNKALKQTNKIWLIVAILQPFLGLILYLITQVAGRCGMMSGIIIISIIMLQRKNFKKIIAIMGISSSILLLFGDFFTEASFSIINSIFISVGYVLMIFWLFLISKKLFNLEENKKI